MAKSVPSVIERIQVIEAKMANLENELPNAKDVRRALLEKIVTLAAILTIGCLVGLVAGTLLASV